MAAKQATQGIDFDISKFDMSKYFQDFKVPGVDVETLVASQRKNIEALTQANKLAYEGVQALIKRQVEIARQTIEESASVARQLVEAGSPQEKAARQTELTKSAFEQALSNARELSEIVTRSNSEAFDTLNKRFFAILDELKDGINRAK